MWHGPARPRGDNRAMPAPTDTAPKPLTDAELATLQAQLDALPAPLEPLDVMALDGYLCGVILQPRPVPPAQWMAHVLDVEGRTPPAGLDTAELQALVTRRHASLQHAIDRRDWFDPWIFELDGDASPSETVLPWVAGFAMALDIFPALAAIDDPALLEPMALVYLHIDPEELEDADALLEVIETLEPPPDLEEAVQDLVRALMLMADVTRPKLSMAPGKRPPQRSGARRPRPGSGSRLAGKRH